MLFNGEAKKKRRRAPLQSSGTHNNRSIASTIDANTNSDNRSPPRGRSGTPIGRGTPCSISGALCSTSGWRCCGSMVVLVFCEIVDLCVGSLRTVKSYLSNSRATKKQRSSRKWRDSRAWRTRGIVSVPNVLLLHQTVEEPPTIVIIRNAN